MRVDWLELPLIPHKVASSTRPRVRVCAEKDDGGVARERGDREEGSTKARCENATGEI